MSEYTREQLQALLAEAKIEIMSLETQLHQLRKAPYTQSTVIGHTTAGRLRVASVAGVVEIEVPVWEDEAEEFSKAAEKEKWDKKTMKKKFKALLASFLPRFPISTRLLMSNSGAPVEVTEPFIGPGQTVLVKRILENSLIEVEQGASSGSMTGSRIMLVLPDVGKIEVGDQVLTGGDVIITKNLGKPQSSTPFKLEHDFAITWEDIGGLSHIRSFFEEIFLTPSLHPELYAKYNYRPPVGALLAGPPGNGKTMIAKALASQIAKARGLKSSGFFPVKGPEILSMWVGQAEQRIRELFDTARDFIIKHKAPAIIFVDEAEACMNKRGSGKSSDVDRTIVPAWLTEMDGLNVVTEHPIFVLLSTNRPELLDPAITREGRIDKKIHIPRPSRESAQQIFTVHLSKAPISKAVTVGELATIGCDTFFDPEHVIARVKRAEDELPFQLQHIISGAMIAATVQSATQLALRRDISTRKFSGIGPSDIREAILDVKTQNTRIAHEDAMKDFCESFKDDVVEVIYVR